MSVLAVYCRACRTPIAERPAPHDKILRSDTYAARLRASDIIERAGQTRDAMLRDAQEQAARCVADAHAQAALVREAILADERARARQECLATVHAFHDELQRYLDTLAAPLLDVLGDAMRTLLGDVPPEARVRASIEAAFAAATRGGPVQLFVHPDDHACATSRAAARATIVPSSDLTPGSCRLRVGQSDVLVDLDVYLHSLLIGIQAARSSRRWLESTHPGDRSVSAATSPNDIEAIPPVRMDA